MQCAANQQSTVLVVCLVIAPLDVNDIASSVLTAAVTCPYPEFANSNLVLCKI
jgi:hypothetical protein